MNRTQTDNERPTSKDTRWDERERERIEGQKSAKHVRDESNLEVIKKRPRKGSASRDSRELGRYQVPVEERERDPVDGDGHSHSGATDRDYQDGKTNQARRDI